MKSLKYILVGIGLVAAFLLGRQCSEPKTVTETVVSIETIHKTDTIWGDTTSKKPIVKWKTKYDTAYIVYSIPISDEDTLRMNEMYKMRFYLNTYRDQFGEVEIQDSVIGYLTHQKAFYTNKRPEKIVDSTKVEKTVLKAPKYEIRGGLDITKTNTYLGLDLGIKKHTIGASYDPLKNQGLIRYRYTLFTK